jgi:hypothetical protein
MEKPWRHRPGRLTFTDQSLPGLREPTESSPQSDKAASKALEFLLRL